MAHRRRRTGGRIGGRGAVIVGRGALGRGVIVAVAVLMSPAAARGCDQGLNQNERAERGGLHKAEAELRRQSAEESPDESPGADRRLIVTDRPTHQGPLLRC